MRCSRREPQDSSSGKEGRNPRACRHGVRYPQDTVSSQVCESGLFERIDAARVGPYARAMAETAKLGQLQIRVNAREKAAIQAAARRAGMDMSAYVLARVLPGVETRAHSLLERMHSAASRKLAMAEFSSMLNELSSVELEQAVRIPPVRTLPDEVRNYLAAMVELVCARRRVSLPQWTCEVAPLRQPHFASELVGLRLHLLMNSPAPFRRRNLFVDTSVGGQV
jgi:uncharacterized protein (DUF1778 family)